MSNLGWRIIEAISLLLAMCAGVLAMLLFAVWLLWGVFGPPDDM